MRQPEHEDMKFTAQNFFKNRGCSMTDTHIGFNGYDGIYQFADFAIEINGKIVLIECLTHWQGRLATIEKKMRLDRHVTLWFVAQPTSRRSLAARGYEFISLEPTDVSHYEGAREIYLSWKGIRIPKPDHTLARLRTAYARHKRGE